MSYGRDNDREIRNDSKLGSVVVYSITLTFDASNRCVGIAKETHI